MSPAIIYILYKTAKIPGGGGIIYIYFLQEVFPSSERCYVLTGIKRFDCNTLAAAYITLMRIYAAST